MIFIKLIYLKIILFVINTACHINRYNKDCEKLCILFIFFFRLVRQMFVLLLFRMKSNICWIFIPQPHLLKGKNCNSDLHPTHFVPAMNRFIISTNHLTFINTYEHI